LPGPQVRDAARIWLVPLLVGLGVYAICISYAPALLNDGDTLSHIVIGRWILDHWAIPFQDPFSFTAHGQIWIPHEWLAEVVFAILYDRLGWGGLVAATAVAAAAAFALLTHALEKSLGARRAAIGAFLALSLTEAHLLARPHALAWPLLVIWMSGIIGARDAGRIPSLALLPVMIVWCNLHGGFVVGLAFAGLLALEAVAEAPAASRLQAIGGWGVFVGLSTASALISPNGINLFLLSLKMLRMNFAVTDISEWHSVDFTHFEPLEVWIALATLGGFLLGLRLPLPRTAMLLLLLYEALTHVRNEELLGIIAPLLVAVALAKQLDPAAPPEASAVARAGGPRTVTASAAVIVAMLMVGLGFFATASALDRSGLRPGENVAPVAAVQAARAAGLRGHVLNSISFAGYLMFDGIPTFIDGRADLFGDAFLARYVAATNGIGDGLPGLLDDYAVEWTIFEPLTPAVTVLDHLPGWERIYADQYAVIFRRGAPG
jgi:hypothetical protein